jgi:DNA repair protein RadC
MAGPAQVAPVMDCADTIARHMMPIAHALEVEKFWVLCLDRKGRLRKLCEVSSGTMSSALVHPREVFRTAIREGSSGVVCVHNHPSGVMPHPVLCRTAPSFHSEFGHRHAA